MCTVIKWKKIVNGLLTPRCKWWKAAGEHLLDECRSCGQARADVAWEVPGQDRRAAHPVRRPEKMSQAKGNA
jgi:hypothetical protein